MEINKIIIDGFANLDKVEINLEKFNALIALNNYGKSNVIKGISFGVDFITASASGKDNMMSYQPVIPINKHLAERSFSFEITFSKKINKEKSIIVYGFSFDWVKKEKSKGRRIKEEYLKIKVDKPDAKFRSFVLRNLKESFFLPSSTGRCDKPIKIRKNELIINKLSNFDELFYLSVIQEINSISITNVETLINPNQIFRTINPAIPRVEYNLAVPDASDVGFFIYSLKKLKIDVYELFKDSVKSLLSTIEDFEPIEIDFKKEVKFGSDEDDTVPFSLPEKLYDIRVKEFNNNQQSSIYRISSGSQKVFYVLAMTIASEINKRPLITFEELENSVHPGLFQGLLIVLDGLTENTKILLTSHSPYLIKYLSTERIKIGIPNNQGLANFREIKSSKFNKIAKISAEEGVSVGDYIFDKMIECHNQETELFTEMCY